MNQTDYTTSNTQLSKNTIFYLNSNLTKKGKSLLIALYKYQSLKHKDLAEILDTRANALTNLITRINKMQKDFILSDSVGRCKLQKPIPKSYYYPKRQLETLLVLPVFNMIFLLVMF